MTEAFESEDAWIPYYLSWMLSREISDTRRRKDVIYVTKTKKATDGTICEICAICG
jgi:hypothetical protein